MSTKLKAERLNQAGDARHSLQPGHVPARYGDTVVLGASILVAAGTLGDLKVIRRPTDKSFVTRAEFICPAETCSRLIVSCGYLTRGTPDLSRSQQMSPIAPLFVQAPFRFPGSFTATAPDVLFSASLRGKDQRFRGYYPFSGTSPGTNHQLH